MLADIRGLRREARFAPKPDVRHFDRRIAVRVITAERGKPINFKAMS
jgi:hypothetical protein